MSSKSQSGHPPQGAQQKAQPDRAPGGKPQSGAAQPQGQLMPDAATLIHLIKQEEQNVQQLEELLLHEKEALLQRQFQNLQQFLQLKRQLLAILEKNANQRQQVLAQMQMPATANGWRELLKKADRSGQASERWQQLEILLRRCHTLNAVNEKLTHRTHMAASQMMDILRGAQNQPKLYTDTGARQRFEGSNRTLGKA
jgi:flagellar biosynthesis/type III secretory pathway chaperone